MTDRAAGAFLGDAISALIADVVDRRRAALADEPDAVHQLRTSVRRIRNVLAAFEQCFEGEEAFAFAFALSSYGGQLGLVRDLEVRAADAAAALTALDLESLRPTLVEPLQDLHATAHRDLVAWHDGADLAYLDRCLAKWQTAPALTSRADRPAGAVGTQTVRRQVRRVVTRIDRLGGTDGEEAVHALRRAARRLRHTADVVGSADVRRAGALGQQVQGMLGDHRDALLLADHAYGCSAKAGGAVDGAALVQVADWSEQRGQDATIGLPKALAALRQLRIP